MGTYRIEALTRRNFSSRLQPALDILEPIQKLLKTRSRLDPQREEGACQPGPVAEQPHPFSGHVRLLTEVGYETGVERRRVHVAHIGGQQQRRLRLQVEVVPAELQKRLLDVPVEVRRFQIADRAQGRPEIGILPAAVLLWGQEVIVE